MKFSWSKSVRAAQSALLELNPWAGAAVDQAAGQPAKDAIVNGKQLDRRGAVRRWRGWRQARMHGIAGRTPCSPSKARSQASRRAWQCGARSP